MGAYNLLIDKLDEFIRKYYKNQLIKGGILFFGFSLLFFIVIALLEFYGEFNILIRSFIFYLYLLLNIYIFIKYLIIPFFKLIRIGKRLTYEQAAYIIGNYFGDVQDKLLNILQLNKISNSSYSQSLINASINQKIRDIKPLRFKLAIRFSENKKYIKYLVIPFILFSIIYLFKPNVITGGGYRIFKHSTYFEKQAPFNFKLENTSLVLNKGEDFKVNVLIRGDALPEEVFLRMDDVLYQMKQEGGNRFSFVMENVQQSFVFYFEAAGYSSPEFSVTVHPNPTILDFTVSLQYPSYLHMKNEVLHNIGDLLLPEGTNIKWDINTSYVSRLHFAFNEAFRTYVPRENMIQFFAKAENSTSYKLLLENTNSKMIDTLIYSVEVIKDQYPSINIQQNLDSINSNRRLCRGIIVDDYGFSNLFLVYAKKTKNIYSSLHQWHYIPISINPFYIEQEFNHTVDFSLFDLAEGDEFVYYYEVKDNDKINGYKSAKSHFFNYKKPSLDEINNQIKEDYNELTNLMKSAMQLAQNINKEVDEIKLQMINKKELGWEDKKRVEDILSKQNKLTQQINQIKKLNSIKDQHSNILQKDDELIEKQKQLNQLFEQIMSEEMKSMFKQMEEMIKKMNKQDINEAMDKIDSSNERIKNELNRNLELMKQLEVEQMLQQVIDQLNNIIENQNELYKKSQDETENSIPLARDQRKLNQEFKDIQKLVNQMQQKNNQLEQPNNLKSDETLKDFIQQQQQDALKNLQENKLQKAAPFQKNAAEQITRMKNDFEQKQQEIMENEYVENIDNLRQILENIVKLSFNQEGILKHLGKINVSDPIYIKIVSQQNEIKEDAEIIKDSLFALSKRVVEIKAVVNKEISDVNFNLEKAIISLQDRNISMAIYRQQLVMTAFNNLSLMLSEILNNMQADFNSMQQNKNGGQCHKPGKSKPGGGKPSIKSMRALQQQINAQMEEMKKQIEQGQKSGHKNQGLSKNLAKLAAQQEAIRNELEKMAQSMKNELNGQARLLEKMTEEMEKTERDIVNKTITRETMIRQKEIITKLLDAEKSEREREEDERRESDEAKNKIKSNQLNKMEYNINKSNGLEILNSIPPSFTPFYKQKINEYLKNRNN